MSEAPTQAILAPLFSKAQATDEFEYACSLLRPRGTQFPGWEPLEESDRLLGDLAALLKAPLLDDTKTRLALLMYCHVIEMSVPYDVIGNMLRVCQGHRYTIDVCQVEHGDRRAFPTHKITLIKQWATATGFSEVGELFDRFFENRIRNAFFHSDYVLHNGNFNIVSGDGVTINKQVVRSLPVSSDIVPRINASFEFISGFMRTIRESLQAYKLPKTVRGRMGGAGDALDIELDVEDGVGLVGFHGFAF